MTHYEQQFERSRRVCHLDGKRGCHHRGATRCLQVKAFVLDSPFARLADLVEQQFSHWPLLPRRLFASLARFYGSLFTGIECNRRLHPRPTRAIWEYVRCWSFMAIRTPSFPIAQGRQLFERIPGPKEFVETRGAAHVQSYAVMGTAYEEKVVNFFKTHLQQKPD